MKFKVVKFGGSSLADAHQFQRVKNIVLSDKGRRYVVVSAPGKRFEEDRKVTDLLFDCYHLAENEQPIDDIFAQIESRFYHIVNGLSLDFNLSDEFTKIKLAIQHNAGRDYVASRGEYLCGLLLAEYLGYDFIDPLRYVCFRDDGTFDQEVTNEKLKSVLSQHEYAVIPGFYGSMPNGTIKTFSRGGSDITGSIVARAAMADVYENWTDVSGFLMADPHQIDHPKNIEVITYHELRELSYMGATVLHEDAIFPVRYAGIPVHIRNTNHPQDKGSLIVASTDVESKYVITGIAGKKGFSIIAIEKEMMNTEIGFGKRVLSVLERHNICFEHLPSGIDTMSVLLQTSSLNEARDVIIKELCKDIDPQTIYIEDHIALIAVVGRGMVKAKGTAAKIFTALAEADINIKMIDQGSSELNIIIGVEEKDFTRALNSIYDAFVKESR